MRTLLLAALLIVSACAVSTRPDAGSPEEARIAAAGATYREAVLAACQRFAGTTDSAADVTEAAFGAATKESDAYRAALAAFLDPHTRTQRVLDQTIAERMETFRAELVPQCKAAILEARVSHPAAR